MRDVDGDALFALVFKAVDQQREVELLAAVAEARGIARQRGKLVLRDRSGFVEKPPDQCRFAVVDRAAHEEAEQALLRRRRSVHQKYPSFFLRSIEAVLS